MADTLIRESIAFGSQPLSPTPQYWNGASYEKAQGINGAVRSILFDSAGQTFTTASPGSVQIVSSAGSTSIFNSSSPAIIGLVSSAQLTGDPLLFTPSNPGHVEIVSSAGNTFTSGSPGLVAVMNASSGGTSVFANSSPAFTSIISSANGTAYFSNTNPATIITKSVGTQANAWSANATISAGSTSNSISVANNFMCSVFGVVTNTAALTLNIEVSQDNSNFSTVTTLTITAGTTSSFYNSFNSAGAFLRLSTSGVSATITATIAAKG